MLGLLAAGPAAAETAQAIIITATGLGQDRNESGQAITVIDSAAIERAQVRSITDLLGRAPSIRVRK